MIDFTNSLTIPTSEGRLLQAPPPRAGLLALPAPVPPITGFLAEGVRLPVIEIKESIPLLLTQSEIEAYLKQKTGFRNLAEINAHFDARMEEHKQRYHERLMQHPAYRQWVADRRVS